MKRQTSDIVQFILDNVADHPGAIVKVTAEKFNVSRQAVLRHMKNLADSGLIVIRGKTRNRQYALKPIAQYTLQLPITQNLKEDEVWRQHIRPLLKDVPLNVMNICQYGFTEMLNNVTDHAEGKNVWIEVTYTPKRIEIQIRDDGIGIFAKIQAIFGLEDPRHSILELAKGKLTTAPEHHTGEGIFFTSRIFDYFSIISGRLYFAHTNDGNDWLLGEETPKEMQGTVVFMDIDPRSKRVLEEVFDYYASDEGDYGFTKTIVPISLARYGDENLMSRSQAKRLLTRFDKFREVMLDFKDIETIGQAFADEVFRVFRKQNPHIEIRWINTSKEVEKAIFRAMSNGL